MSPLLEAKLKFLERREKANSLNDQQKVCPRTAIGSARESYT